VKAGDVANQGGRETRNVEVVVCPCVGLLNVRSQGEGAEAGGPGKTRAIIDRKIRQHKPCPGTLNRGTVYTLVRIILNRMADAAAKQSY